MPSGALLRGTEDKGKTVKEGVGPQALQHPWKPPPAAWGWGGLAPTTCSIVPGQRAAWQRAMYPALNSWPRPLGSARRGLSKGPEAAAEASVASSLQPSLDWQCGR